MSETLVLQYPVVFALLAGLVSWGITAFGAAGVFIVRTVSQKFLDVMMGFAAGVMIAASFWSLLDPAIKLSDEMGGIKWLAPMVGFLAGGVFLWSVDRVLPHLNVGQRKTEGFKTGWHTSILTFIAITFHNFPEGLAIGVAFGAAAAGIPGATVAGALALAIGIGIQNFPEGFAVSVPFRKQGLSRMKCFMFGQSSALIEPVAAVIGAFGVILMRPLLPYVLAFAAGAMIYVTVEEIIPEAQLNSTRVATAGAMLGFTVMMVLDVALG